MKQPIATEKIFNVFGQQVGVKYHYEDGSNREVTIRTPDQEAKRKSAMRRVNEIIENWNKKY